MNIKNLTCLQCDKEFDPEEIRFRCTACGESLDVKYDYDRIAKDVSWSQFQKRPFDHFRYREFLPVVRKEHMISMAAGGTPLLQAARIDVSFELLFKIESMNPTGSFKDRGTSVELGAALDHGAKKVVVASTGNMGASIAAYTSRGGMECRIYVPGGTYGPKRKQMREHGAEIREVKGGYDDAAERAWSDWEQEDWYLMGDYPYRGEGEKSVGFEIAEQTTPDYIVLPVGNGTLFHAVWKSFQELRKVGLIEERPRMMAVQAEGCNTVVRAFQENRDHVEPVDHAETIAGAIACEDPIDGEPALMAIRESNGMGLAVSEDEIREARRELARKEGIYAEEAGAVSFAGIKKAESRFEPGDTVVAGITGHGLKS